MTRIEKIIVVVLGLLSLSFLGYMIVSWTSQGTPAAAAPGVPAAAKVDPSAKADPSADRHRAAKQLKDKITAIRDKRIILCRRMPHHQIDDCEKHANGMWQMQGLIIDDADKKGQEAFLILLWQNADKVEAEIAAMERSNTRSPARPLTSPAK
jgi:hypothetical protein